MIKKSSVVSHPPAAFAHPCAAQALFGHQGLNMTMIYTHHYKRVDVLRAAPLGRVE